VNIFEKLGFLKLHFGTIQSVDEMTVVPILGDDLTKNTSKPENIKFKKTSSYGTMIFENEDDSGFGIVPSNVMVISEKAAQDHAMSEVGVIGWHQSKTWSNACCVQQTQGGYLTDQNNEYNVLPLQLRKALLDPTKRADKDYDKLWGDITDFLADVPGINSGQGHLEYFFKPFRKELEDFAAEFEPVENQIGAVVLFNGHIVGLEIMPTVLYWSTLWKWLIRGCYGAQLLKLKKAGQLKGSMLTLPKLKDNMISEIESFMIDARTNMLRPLDTFSSQLSTPKNTGVQTSIQRLVQIGSGGGDMVYENAKPVYLSAVM